MISIICYKFEGETDCIWINSMLLQPRLVLPNSPVTAQQILAAFLLGQMDPDASPIELVEVHVVHCIESVGGRLELDEAEAAVFPGAAVVSFAFRACEMLLTFK